MASANLHNSVANRSFPDNVFTSHWECYYFFDADLMFQRRFVQILKDLLEIEEGHSACFADFDAKPNGTVPASFTVNGDSSAEEYALILRGDLGKADGWTYRFGRFGCMSDIGEWCIYCERNNEIAVIALREGTLYDKYWPILAELGVARIADAVAQPLSFGFKGLPREWSQGLQENYS